MKKTFSALFALLMVLSCVTVTAAAKTGFSDVEDDRWSAASIKYAVDNGYMKGVGGDKFDPEGSLTRAMVATVLWRREGEPKPSAPSGFSDVPANEWYTDAVAWAKETGVVKGITATTFEPDGLITREQLATMLFRFSSSAPVSVPERADLTPFSDDEKVSDWANEPLEWAVESGLIKGTDGNRLAPEGDATREQFAAIIERYDGTFTLKYNTPVVRSHYTEPEYPLVDDADFYVSTAGDDNADGSFDHPFRTWERARDAVRALDKTGRDGITVAFFAGDYGPLSVSLSAEDSGTPECPITYCKYGDGDVVFNNGVDLDASSFERIGDGEKHLFDKKNEEKIKKYDLSGLADGGLAPDSVFLVTDDGLCDSARYPNKYKDGTDALLDGGADTIDSYSMILKNTIFINRFAKYTPEMTAGMKLYGYIVRGYAKDTCTVTGYDPETRILTIGSTSSDEYDHRLRDGWADIKMAVTNVSLELDAKGEYWIDPSTRVLYVFSPEGNYHIPVYGDMISMNGTDRVSFRGLSFRNSAGRFISGSLCHGVTVDLCDFSVTAAREGVYFDDCDVDRPLDLTITNSKFSLAYGQSVKVYGRCTGRYRYVKRANVVFDNNLVSSSNLVYDFLNSVHFESCSGLTVTHNDFVHTSRGAVSFDHSYNVLIEYNNFDSVMENSEDGGAVYNWGSVDGWSVRVAHNFFGPMHYDGTGTFGYYIDDNSGGAEVYGNLFYNAVCPVMFHLGRDNTVRDNVFVSTNRHEGVGVSIPHRGMIDELGYEQAIRTFPTDRTKVWWESVFNLINTYPEYREGVEKWCPGILSVHMDPERMDDPDFYLNPVNSIIGNVYVNPGGEVDEMTDKYGKQYITVEGLKGFTLADNPVFVNPSRGDYRIREDADFPDIHFENIGRY